MMKYVIGVLGIVAVLGGIVWYVGASRSSTQEIPQIPPNQSDRYTEEAVWRNADENLIEIDLLSNDRIVSNPFVVSGKARGNWYFEASFPLQVVDATGNVLVTMPVEAQGEWMTTEFVPFNTTVTLPEGYRGLATLVLRNDNASGLPEHERSVSIPIFVE